MLVKGILPVATQVSVLENKYGNRLRAESLGFFSHVRRLVTEKKALCESVVVITRVGKSGKERLDVATVLSPVMFVDDDPGFVDFYEAAGYNKMTVTLLDKMAPSTPENLMGMSAISFLGWSLAKVLYMMALSRHGRIAFPANSPKNPLYKYNDMKDHGSERLDSYKEWVSLPAKRTEIIRELRSSESGLAKGSLKYLEDLEKKLEQYIANVLLPLRVTNKLSEDSYTQAKSVLLNNGGLYV
jgi:hypothetical protein